MDIHLQCFYFSVFNDVPSLIIGIIIGEIKLQNIIYILYVCLNGLFIQLIIVQLYALDILQYQNFNLLLIYV